MVQGVTPTEEFINSVKTAIEEFHSAPIDDETAFNQAVAYLWYNDYVTPAGVYWEDPKDPRSAATFVYDVLRWTRQMWVAS